MAAIEGRRRVPLPRVRSALVLLSPGLLVLVPELLWRLGRLWRLDPTHRHGYLASAAGSMIFWALAVTAVARRRASGAVSAVVFVVLFGVSMGVQGAYRSLWNYYCSLDSVLFLSRPLSIALGALPLPRPEVWLNFVGSFGCAIGIVLAARRWVSPAAITARAATALWALAILGLYWVPASYHQIQASTPDLIYFHAVVAQAKHLKAEHGKLGQRAERRDPDPVPPMTAKPARRRNVLFLLQESERWDAACTAFDPACDVANQATNHLFPGRYPLNQMRAQASATAISTMTLFTGLPPSIDRKTTYSAPLLWEYALAAGCDTAYWTSQNLQFESSRLFWEDVPFGHFATATNLDPEADFLQGADDFAVTDRAIADWAELREPFFAVVHYSNVHNPYKVSDDLAPFQPTSEGPADKTPHLRNNYLDAVYRSDAAMAKLLEYVRLTEKGARTVVVVTSDHGEALRERGFGHTFALFDEQIRVPTWIDAPASTLDDDEAANLGAASDAPTYHVDLAATMLDLLGLWDDPGLGTLRARTMGHPLTRAARTTEPVPMSGCGWVWQCGYPNWGVQQGSKKLFAWTGDMHYHCFDLANDPDERVKLPATACPELLEIANKLFPDPETASSPYMALDPSAP